MPTVWRRAFVGTLLLLSCFAPAAHANVTGVSLLAASDEGERPLPPPDRIDEGPLVGDAPLAPGEEDPNKAFEPEVVYPTAAALGGVAGGLLGVTAGLLATTALVGATLGVAVLLPISVPLLLGVGAAALISATLIPAFAGTGAGIGALLSQGTFDLMNVLSVLVFTAAIYITVAVVMAVIAAAVALFALLFAAVAGGGSLSGCGGSCGSCNGCGTCPSAATTSSAQAGPGCAQASMLPPFWAVQVFLGREPPALMVFPTLGGMVGSLTGGVALAAMLGLGGWAAGAAVLGPEDPSLLAIAVGAGIGGFVLGNIVGAVVGGGVSALAATAPTLSLEEARGGKRGDDDEFRFSDDSSDGYDYR